MRGAVAGASWTYLLPSLELGRVVVIGRATAGTLATLSRLSVTIEIDPGSSGRRPRDRDADLLFVAGNMKAAAIQPLMDRAAGDLSASGRVYLETKRRHLGLLEAHAVARGLIVEQWLAIRPSRGELQSAVSLDDRGIAADLVRRGLAGPPIRLLGTGLRHRLPRRAGAIVDALARRTERLLDSRLARFAVRSDRVAVVLARTSQSDESRLQGSLPKYLRDLAGVAPGATDPAATRWAFAARGEYNTQKPLVLVYPDGSDRPDLVVKMTRDAAFNDRLAAERDALVTLDALATVAAHVPRVRFSGRHAGLAFLGETVLEGAPFERSAQPARTDALLDRAVDFFIELGLQTRRPADGRDLAAALDPLVGRFLELWPMQPLGVARLRADLEMLASVHGLFTTFVHGDPGTWNLVVDEDGRIGVLDWEAAEEAGPPLWDIARLVQAYSLLAPARTGRLRVTLPGGSFTRARRHLLDGSSSTPALAATIERYRDAVNLSRDAVEPLLRLAWVGRALKEADRLAASALERGLHARLVRLVATREDLPGWRALVGRDRP